MASTPVDDLHRNLMVNFIPHSWDNAALEVLFQQYGPIESAKVIVDPATKRSKGFGFVKFVNRSDAENCISAMQGAEVEGRRLKIQKAELGKGPQGAAQLYVSGFDPVSTGESELREIFAPYGNIVKLNLHTPKPGMGGVAFVTFEYFAEAQLAMEALHGARLGDKMLTVRLAGKALREVQGRAGAQTAMSLAGPLLLPSVTGPLGLTQSFALRTPQPSARFDPYKRPAQKGAGTILPQNAALLQAAASNQAALLQAAASMLPANQAALLQMQLGGAAAAAGGGGGVVAPDSTDGTYCVFVYGIQGVNKTFLWNLFQPYGTITNCKVPEGKNFGFVHMPNYAEAANAISNLNGAQLPGFTLPLQVSFKQ